MPGDQPYVITGGIVETLVWVVLIAAVVTFSFYIAVRIVRRLGYPGWFGIVGCLPVVGIAIWTAMALAESPIENELYSLRGTESSGSMDPGTARLIGLIAMAVVAVLSFYSGRYAAGFF